ncbi:MAG: hypothetical protein ACXVHS_04225 [Methanobacterium sp.]
MATNLSLFAMQQRRFMYTNLKKGDHIKRKTTSWWLLLLSILIATAPVSATDSITGYFHPSGYYYGETGWHSWTDYCPLCHHRNCLEIGMKGISDEISCEICGADYDGTNGLDKYDGGARENLIPYNGIIDGYIIKDGYITDQKMQENTEVQAQSITSKEYVEFAIDNQKYKIDSQTLQDLKKAIS